jgi:hypothetical protein
VGDEDKSFLIQWGFKPRLNEGKPPADASDFLKGIYRASSIKIQAQIRRANLITVLLLNILNGNGFEPETSMIYSTMGNT